MSVCDQSVLQYYSYFVLAVWHKYYTGAISDTVLLGFVGGVIDTVSMLAHQYFL